MEAKNMKILLVEDEAILRESLRDSLKEDGYNVECVESGEDALEKIRKEEFDIVVLDLRLPGIDGLQVFERAKKLKPEIKGIVITAYPSKETREEAKRLGLLDYLAKPFEVEDLEKVIKEANQIIEDTVRNRTHHKREIIKNSQLFWTLSDDQIDKVAELCREERYKAGAHIFSEGESVHNLYIIKEGKVALEMEVRIGSRTRRQATLDVISKGEVFGWSALSQRPVFTMSAVSTKNTKLLAFSGDHLRRLFDEDLDLCRKVMNELISLVSDRLSHAKETLAHVLSVTSHDLRAPLATVQSCLDVLLGGYTGDITDKQRELLTGSKQRISDLMSMINNILDISYMEIRKQDFERVSLPEVIESSIGDIQGVAQQKGMQINNNVPTKLPQVLVIPKRLQQVLTNLLSNAVKFTPAGGRVSISSQEMDDLIQVEVSDTGIGISPEEMPKLFSDFHRGLKVDALGAGLGLSIARRIVEAHGGKIWVESPCPETGIGSKFSFTIPKALAAVEGKLKEEKVVIREASILVADDDPEMLKLTTLVLQSQGYRVSTARDGEEALAKIGEEKPDLLILDLLMPKMDGFEVCKRLMEQAGASGNRIPILILSAVREDSSRRRYELETRTDLGVDGYVEKPISPPILLQRVEKVLTERKSRF